MKKKDVKYKRSKAFGYCYKVKKHNQISGVVFSKNKEIAKRIIIRTISKEYKKNNKKSKEFYSSLQTLDVFELGYVSL